MTVNIEQLVGGTVSRETEERLRRFEFLLRAEARVQNLIAASTLDDFYRRHVLDSAQLLRFGRGGAWVDVGSGAGLPGVVLAVLGSQPTTLVEPRRLRADFLRRTVDDLQLGDVNVITSKIEVVDAKFDVITARAVASLSKLLGITRHLAHTQTIWVLPKGRNVQSELVEAEGSWHYDLRVEPSCTDADSSILLLSNVRAKP